MRAHRVLVHLIGGVDFHPDLWSASEAYRVHPKWTQPSFGKVLEMPTAMQMPAKFHTPINERYAPPSPAAISQPKIHANALAAGAPPRTPLGSLQIPYLDLEEEVRKGDQVAQEGMTGEGERGGEGEVGEKEGRAGEGNGTRPSSGENRHPCILYSVHIRCMLCEQLF